MHILQFLRCRAHNKSYQLLNSLLLHLQWHVLFHRFQQLILRDFSMTLHDAGVYFNADQRMVYSLTQSIAILIEAEISKLIR